MLDVLIVSLIFIAFEKKMLRHRYFLLSPFSFFIFCFNLIYTLPFLILEYFPTIGEYQRVSYLSEEEQQTAFILIRIMFYIWILGILFYLALSKKPPKFKLSNIATEVQIKNVYLLIIIVIVINVVYLGAGVGFSPTKIIERFYNPRDYTYIKEGYGPLTYLKLLLSQIGIFYVAMIFINKKARNIKDFLACLFLLLICIGGGTKTLLVVIPVFFILVYQKYVKKIISLKKILFYYSLIAIVMISVLYFSFNLGLDGEQDKFEQYQRIGRYQAEAFYTPKVYNNFNWNWSEEYLISGLTDAFAAVVPRAIWEEKPQVGYYRKYWKPVFEGNAESYQTTTFGAISESLMMFGSFGPAIYGIVFTIICILIYEKYLRSQTILQFFLSCFYIYWIYFLLRAGLTGFVIVQTLFFVVVANLFLKKFLKNNGSNYFTKV